MRLRIAIPLLLAASTFVSRAADASCTSYPELCGLTVTSIIEQPDLERAIDVVLLGDGFTTGYADGGDWKTAADAMINRFKTQTGANIYGQYAETFNFHIVDVISETVEVGDTDLTNTALGMKSVGSTVITSSSGKVSTAALNAPDVDATVAIANTTGGRANANFNSQLTSGGRIRISRNSGPISHELGHALFHLADEYSESSKCGSPTENSLLNDRNVTTDASCHKFSTVPGAGCVEGGQYCVTGVFRSASGCLMRNGGNAAPCPVCAHSIKNMIREKRTGNDAAIPWTVITNPTENAVISAEVTLRAALFDDFFTPAFVAFHIDDSFVGQVDEVSTWAALPYDTRLLADGTHTVHATATDAAGHTVNSPQFSFATANWTSPSLPVVSIGSPAPDSTFDTSVFIFASTDSKSSAGTFALFVDGVPIAATHDSRFLSARWEPDAAAAGEHVLTAQFVTPTQDVITSTPITITFAPGTGETPPKEGSTAGLWISTPKAWDTVGAGFLLEYSAYGVTPTALVTLTVDGLDTLQLPELVMQGGVSLGNPDGGSGGGGSGAGSAWIDSSAWLPGPHTLDLVLHLMPGAITRSLVVVREDALIPTAFILAPTSNGSPHSGPVDFDVTGAAPTGLDKLVMRIDGAEVGYTTNTPGTIAWDSTTVPDGWHRMQAEARGTDGTVGLSKQGSLTVDNSPPTATIVWPAAGDIIAAGLMVPKLDTSDPGGSVAETVFYIDGVQVARGSPASAIFTILTPGSFTARVEAIDRAGQVGSSATIPFSVASCSSVADCDDGNACTVDQCAATGACTHAPIQDCCADVGDCIDSDPCTTDSCDGGTCTYARIPSCCADAFTCNDADTCTRDVCDFSGGSCSNPAGNCCASAVECDDGDRCTVDSCFDEPSGICANLRDPTCCDTPEQCDDNDPCTADACTAGTCEHVQTLDCCQNAADCDDSDPCTDSLCLASACVYPANDTCCTGEADCVTYNTCSPLSCNAATNQCESAAPEAGCCVFDIECDDRNSCTRNFCDAGTCAAGTEDLCLDSDADTHADWSDNCPTVSNTDQQDTDLDVAGDVCDNCPNVANASQTDNDADGTGNACDACPADGAKIVEGVCGCGVSDVDSDVDGTADCEDTCPDDPLKDAPGVCGCTITDDDTDGDGVPDCNDACPNDNTTSEVGVCGCGIAETDTDGDQTPDCVDECPTDIAKVTAGTCGCGVEDVDTDSDGTLDCDDACAADPDKIEPGTCGCDVTDADTDGDGTVDCEDACPLHVGKVIEGQCGCSSPDVDTDGDGALDCDDACPFDAGQSSAGPCECDDPAQDTDGDGTADCDDDCAHDPQKSDSGACGCGQPDTTDDADGDGVLDCLDGCPADKDKAAPGICGCDIPEAPEAAQCGVAPGGSQQAAPLSATGCACAANDDSTAPAGWWLMLCVGLYFRNPRRRR